MCSKPFKSELVLEERISDSTIRAYYVGFDENKFRLEPLVNVIVRVIPEFALGSYEGSEIPLPNIVDRLREAAKRVYTTDNYKRRGEFGELILHLLLRDFCSSVPLISKIYFKDAENVNVHGFDGVHIVTDGNKKELWLGESKFYKNGSEGVKDLAKDFINHTERDYLRAEFNLIKTKLPTNIPDIDYWRNLLDENQRLETVINCITIPMVCTYDSDLFNSHNDNTIEYIEAFLQECRSLYDVFSGKLISTDINVLLLLLPVPSKDKLATEIDKRLKSMQSI